MRWGGTHGSILATNFRSMRKLGDPVLYPFLQDVVQWAPLAQTMGSMVLTNPLLLPSMLASVRAFAVCPLSVSPLPCS